LLGAAAAREEVVQNGNTKSVAIRNTHVVFAIRLVDLISIKALRAAWGGDFYAYSLCEKVEVKVVNFNFRSLTVGEKRWKSRAVP